MPRELFNELLITEVSKRPLLWNVKDNNFRNRTSKESLWEEVRDALLKHFDTGKQKKKKKQLYWSYCNLGPTDLSIGRTDILADNSASNGNLAPNSGAATCGSPARNSRKDPDASLDTLEVLFQTPGCADANEAGSMTATPSTSGVPSSRVNKRQKRRHELDETDRQLQSVRNAIAAHRPMDASSHFLLSLRPQVEATPAHMLMHLKMELLSICEHYSQGKYPVGLLVHPSFEEE
ncbi:uncharacterized protein [Dermacentor andersoni]|uniref:uncharacterized protein n=1 Tax=Dermacentor andersoni TaxID=34620 RepID=UPI003B3AE739